MKKIYSLIICILAISFISNAQSWYSVGSGNFSFPGDFPENAQTVIYQDTMFAAYAEQDANGWFASINKFNGASWQEIAILPMAGREFKFTYGEDNKPLVARVTKLDQIQVMFDLNVLVYENGSFQPFATTNLFEVAQSQVSGQQVSTFDFDYRQSDGSMAAIFRFPTTAASFYAVKIQDNPWHRIPYFSEVAEGTSGAAVENGKIKFTETGTIILSKRATAAALNLHSYVHNETSSEPTILLADQILSLPVSGGLNSLNLTSRGDSVIFIKRDNSSNFGLYSVKNIIQEEGEDFISVTPIRDYGSDYFSMIPIFNGDDEYMLITEEDGLSGSITGYIMNLENGYAPADWETMGGGPFTQNEDIVIGANFTVNPTTSEIGVVYSHGPPMNNTAARRLGCAPSSISYDADDNELSITSNYSVDATFEWTLCGETDLLGTASTFTPEEDGDYQVTVFDGSCEVTSNCVSVQIVEEEEEEEDLSVNDVNKNKLTLFPNPATSTVSVKNAAENTNVKIYNAQGQLVLTHVLTNANDSIDISTLNKGVYSVLLLNNNHAVRSKFVKQ